VASRIEIAAEVKSADDERLGPDPEGSAGPAAEVDPP
jgi:hypothetical protein